jgi:hypothetical protein
MLESRKLFWKLLNSRLQSLWFHPPIKKRCGLLKLLNILLMDYFQQLSSKDFEFLEDALDTLGKGKKRMLVEKEELQDLKDEMADYREVLFLSFCKTNH